MAEMRTGEPKLEELADDVPDLIHAIETPNEGLRCIDKGKSCKKKRGKKIINLPCFRL